MKLYIQYIGIAADEPVRLKRLGSKQISLLDKYGITEEQAKDICKITIYYRLFYL